MAALTDDVLDRLPRRAGIAPSAIVWGLAALAIAVFWPTLTALGGTWLSVADYQHGFAIAAICAVWLFKARRRIDASVVRARPAALLALAAVMLAWMIAFRANSDMLQQLLLPIVVLLAVLAALGTAVVRQVLAPISFLYFAIPVWDHFIPLLQWLTTHVAEGVLGLMGVPTVVEGHNVTIPAGQFSIIEGCSGKRYFIIGLAFAALAAAMQGVRGRRLIYLMAAAAATALVTNWLRVVIVIYAGHISNMQHYLVAVEHKTLGYVLFAPMLLLIGYAARRLGQDDDRVATAPEAGASRPAPRKLLAGAIGPVILLAAPMLVSASSPSVKDSAAAVAQLPIMTGEWQGPLPADADWTPRFASPQAERRASYAAARSSAGVYRVEVYLNSYGVQSPGRELVYYSNTVVPGDRWTVVERLPRGEAPLAMVVAADSGSRRRWVIAQTHVVGGKVVSAPALAQLYYGLSAVWRPAPAGAIALATPCAADCNAAVQHLNEFWTDNGSTLVGLTPRSF